MAHASRLHVEQVAAIGLQRVADVAQGGAVGQDYLPVGARARKQLAAEFRTGEGPAGQSDYSPVALGDVAELERLGNRGFQPVDLGQPRIGEPNLMSSW